LKGVRVRFAPSPTGMLHIGGARTALFNWLFARSNEGKFILRLEDTDLTRSSEDSARKIMEDLQWLGLGWDEGPDKGGPFGPYRQSERLPIYKKYLQKLLQENKAYYCFCTGQELQAEREKAQQEKRDYKYGRTCRSLSRKEVDERFQEGKKAVIRLKVPDTGQTVVHDLIRGKVEFTNRLFDDFIIARSDGWPTYNFAVAVDDYTMNITHVIRAEEHLSNTPKQLLIYEALDFQPPEFAHVSMILAPDRSKLSKRHGATSVKEFRDEGYLPESLVNYLALLGWATGEDKDFWDIEEMVEKFRLEDMSRSPAIYDKKKLNWMNGHYLSRIDLSRITVLLESEAKARGWLAKDNRQEYFYQVIDLVRSRAKTVNEIPEQAAYFFEEFNFYNEKGIKKYFCKDNSLKILYKVLEIIEESQTFAADELEKNLREQAEKMKIKAADMIHPARLALSGRTVTPGLFEVMELLGKDRCALRIKKAINFIKTKNN